MVKLICSINSFFTICNSITNSKKKINRTNEFYTVKIIYTDANDANPEAGIRKT